MTEPGDTNTSSIPAPSTNPIPMPEMQHHDYNEQGSAPAFPVPETQRRQGQDEGQRAPSALGQEAFGSAQRGSASMPQAFSTSPQPNGQPDGSQPQYGRPSGPPALPPTSSRPQTQSPPPPTSLDPRSFSPPQNQYPNRSSQSQDGFRPPSHPPPTHAQDPSRAFSPPPSYQAINGPGRGPAAPYGPGKPNNYPPGPNSNNMQPGPHGQMMQNNDNGHYNRGGGNWPYPGPNQSSQQQQQGGYGGYGPQPAHFAPQGHGYGNSYGGQQGYGLGRPSQDSAWREEDERYKERLTGPNTVDTCGCGFGACLAILCCCCLLE